MNVTKKCRTLECLIDTIKRYGEDADVCLLYLKKIEYTDCIALRLGGERYVTIDKESYKKIEKYLLLFE